MMQIMKTATVIPLDMTIWLLLKATGGDGNCINTDQNSYYYERETSLRITDVQTSR